MLTPAIRKLALTAHVTSSVGWLGAVATFLALALAGLSRRDAASVQAAYIASEMATWYVIVPLAFASLITGLVVSLGTPWGLFRHYWVVVKFALTILSTLLLLLHTQPIGILARAAGDMTLVTADVGRLQMQLVGDAAAALVALLVNVTLSVYKPRGLTPYGWRKQLEELKASDVDSQRAAVRSARWMKIFTFIVVGLLLLFVVLHLTGRGLGSLHH